MTIAHLILAHKDPEHVAKLVNKLSYKNDCIYLHIDKKSDISEFQRKLNGSKVIYIQNRVSVYWASYSVVEATLNSFIEILETGTKYDYVNLISGQDYPIKSNSFIHEYIKENNGKIFMSFESIKDEWKEALPRLTKYHLTSYRIPVGRYRLERIINRITPTRKFPENIIAVGRSQWFTAPLESIKYIIDHLAENEWMSRFFNLSWAPDEIIFQTILYNSHFRNNMVNNNLRYIDWRSGGASPKELTIKDLDALSNSDQLFARKFCSKSNEIIDYLDHLTT